MTYDTRTLSYGLSDNGGYDWLFESGSVKELSDNELYSWIDLLIDISKELDIDSVEQNAQHKVYPCFGYTTEQRFNDKESWIEFKLSEIEKDYEIEREYVFNLIRSHEDSE